MKSMKRLYNRLLAPAVMVLMLASCAKDIPMVKVDEASGKAAVLTASQAAVVLNEAKANELAEEFSWTSPAYNLDLASKYTLQFVRSGKGFDGDSVISENAGSILSKSYTHKSLNSIALSLNLAPQAVGKMDVRVLSSANDSLTKLISNVVTVTVTPYPTDQFLYCPGAYQGWDPASANLVRAVNKDKKYEGYIWFPAGKNEFKMTDGPNWSGGIFGDKSGGTSGQIASPGDNFKVAAEGYFKINADYNKNTWTATQTDWGLIGSATPTGWGSDTNMVYDPATKTWKLTVALVAGDIKFRANDAWDINFGDDGANGSLEYGGANIAIASAGNYTITLDLNEAGRYKYTVKKN
jgi:hypothetical protein